MFLLSVKTGEIPAMGYLGRVPLPHLQEEHGPHGHEDGEKDGRCIIKQVGHFGVQARLAQVPVVAKVVADRAHCRVQNSVTDLIAKKKTVSPISKSLIKINSHRKREATSVCSCPVS